MASDGTVWEPPRVDDAGLWIRSRHPRAATRTQGWKLHVSANEASAAEVLRRALPVLLGQDANFKLAASPTIVAALNHGQSGMSQIGKFITVYPNDDAQAARLATALDAATIGLAGPVVPTDRPLRDGSLVHYRYGSFAAEHLQLPIGEIVSIMRSPNGEPVQDRRVPYYDPPAWATDPFAAAGITGPLPNRSPLVGGRYLVIGTLQRSARSTIYMAVDLSSPRRCVLKTERRALLTEADGAGAGERLRHEARTLRSLAPDPSFPALYDLIEEEQGTTLVMEQVEGQTFGQRIKESLGQGILPSSEQVISWGRALTRILATLHDHGIIYRDLKSANIMAAPDSRLRLIDFDIVQEAGTGMALWGGGTRGYMSPQHKAGAPASVSDDVYSLGAVLYLAATGAEPASSPHPMTLLERPVTILNPAIDPALAGVIASCLNHDPARRYQNMAEVDAALAAINRPHATPAPDLGCGSPVAGQDSGSASVPLVLVGAIYGDERDARAPRRDSTTEDYFHGLARRLGDTLSRAAQPVPGGTGMAWTSLHNLAHGVQARDLNFGGSGALLALAEAVSVFGDPRHFTVAAEGARWLRAAPSLGAEPLPGLYVGEAGIGAGLLRAGQALDDQDLIAAALRKGRLVGSLPHRSPDYFNGTAGRLRFHLLLWDETGEPEQLDFAISAGERLLATVDRTPFEGRGAQWVIPEGYGDLSGQAQLGYAHGLAGIADAVLDLYETTGEPRWRECAQQAAYTLTRYATRRGFIPGAPCLDWPIRAGGSFFGPFWCHGAAGIGQFFLHAAQLDILPGAMEIALGAARSVARGSRHAGPTQCHGLAGNIEFLLDVYQATGDRAFLHEGRSLATLLAAFASERDGQLVWPSESPMIFTPDYLVGYAGVLPCLLRLADPERRPRQLSRAGFRFPMRAR